MHRICIIGVYFGTFPKYFKLWLNSCKYNDTIDFLIITDQHIHSYPRNLKIKNMTFVEFKNLVEKKFDFKISLERPYKICDYRPAFGLIFEEFLKGYDFWGHCDFDMIFGDLRKYFTDELLSNYDKILTLGHLSLYRNTFENNNRFKLKGSLVGDYKKVFTTDKGFAFDETYGVYSIFKFNNIPVYSKRIFADISSIHKRFRLALKDLNYKHQIFVFDKGKIIREYFIKKKYFKEEFVYIHIKKPKNLAIKCTSEYFENYYITNTGFYAKTNDTKIDDIIKYNCYQGALFEVIEKLKFMIINKLRVLNRKVEANRF